MEHQKFVDLLVELCPLLGLKELFAEVDAGSCTLICDDETAIVADHERDRKRVVLTAPVDVMEDDASPEVMVRLLEFNHGVLGDRGGWLSLRDSEEVPGTLILQTMVVGANPLARPTLRAAVETCIASIAQARSLLAEADTARLDDAASSWAMKA